MSEAPGVKIEDRGSRIEERPPSVPVDSQSSVLHPRSSILGPRPSSVRAWCFLVWLSIQRQARARGMIAIALGLLIFMATIVELIAVGGRWSMAQWPVRRTNLTCAQLLEQVGAEASLASVGSVPGSGVTDGIIGAYRAVLAQSGFAVFSRWIVFSVFIGFMLPFWSLAFATEALGGERESRTLVWLLSRPLSRPAIYAGKFVALLPWTLGFNVGGFALLCLAAGAPGRQAFALYWPAIALASLAFCALFHLMSAVFRRPAIIAICYTFFLEIILGTMPGYMKRISIGFYTRCLMSEAAEGIGAQPWEKPSIYLPVDGVTAITVLLGATAALLVAGMIVFAHSEYREDL